MEKIEIGTYVLIRGGVFRVKCKDGEFWTLSLMAKVIHGKETTTIKIPESEVIQGIQDYENEKIIRDCSRTETPEKDMRRLRFLPR